VGEIVNRVIYVNYDCLFWVMCSLHPGLMFVVKCFICLCYGSPDHPNRPSDFPFFVEIHNGKRNPLDFIKKFYSNLDSGCVMVILLNEVAKHIVCIYCIYLQQTPLTLYITNYCDIEYYRHP
jgi:hypothetical protein